jgi:HD-GYP domain-containing protein (c-di-GMP phosphodiesterase class II)
MVTNLSLSFLWKFNTVTPYRSAYSKKEAIRIIEKENSQFDPQVLSILYKIVLEKKSNTSKSKAG